MKILCRDGVALVAPADDAVLDWRADRLRVGTTDYMGLTAATVVLHEDAADVPDDFQASWYRFDGATWTANPDEPRPEPPTA